MNFQPYNPNAFQVEGGVDVCSLPPLSLRCPHCRQLGSFGLAKQHTAVSYAKSGAVGSIQATDQYYASIRICPNEVCRGLVFVVEANRGGTLEIEPPELLDFNPENLPPVLLTTLQEAVSCHAAGAHRAAAMMVRRLLEEICDLNKAQGNSLHQKLESLKTKIVLPQALFDAMSELKALGNDAAHIEAKAYDDIGNEEVSDSIELAKEILKALYQLQGLLGRLQARKASSNPPPQ